MRIGHAGSLIPPLRPLLRLLLATVLLGWMISVPGLAVRAASPAPDGSASPWHHRADDGSPAIDLWFGYSSTCPHCREAEPFLDRLEAELPWLVVHRLQVNAPDSGPAVARLDELARLVGESFEYVPTFLFAERIVVGWDSEVTTGAAIDAALTAYRARLLADPGTSHDPGAVTEPERVPGSPTDTTVSLPLLGRIDAAQTSLPLLAVVLGGLDAFNPCALAVLLFLLSVLAGTRDRRRMVLVGGIFVAVSGLAYFVFMAAWLNVFLIFGALRWVTIAAGIAAVAAALINLKDHFWFRRGISLQLPESAKPAVFGRILDISESTRLRAMILTTVLVAVVANAYEMLCTGGFPVVFTRVLTLQELPAPAYYAYLALYCLVYVTPPALMVLLFVTTLGSRGLSVREARDLKLLSGLLMLGFGLLLLLAPDLLTDLGATVALFGGAILTWLLIVILGRLAGGRSASPRTAG